MSEIYQIMNSTTATAIGWSLLHSLWQGLAIFVALNMAKVILFGDAPNKNYWIYYAGLFMQIAWFAVTLTTSIKSSVSASGAPAATMYFMINSGPVNIPVYKQLLFYLNSQAPSLFLLWVVGVAFLLLRFLGGLVQIQLLRTRYLVEVEDELKQQFKLLCDRLELTQSIQVFFSSKITMPGVVGFFKPMILIPVGLLGNLSPQQVETLLIHELMHIKRNDYLLNIIQSIAEILLFFNPFTWWISSRIRDEREKACDDEVMKYSDRITYATALVVAREWEMNSQLVMGLHKGKNDLITRINRIMGKLSSKNGSYSFKKMIAHMVVLTLLVTSVAFITKESARRDAKTEEPEIVKSDLSKEASGVSDAPRARQNEKAKPAKQAQENPPAELPPVPDLNASQENIVIAAMDTPEVNFELQKLLEELKVHQQEWAKQMEADQKRLQEELQKIDLNEIDEEARLVLKEIEKLKDIQFNVSREQMEKMEFNMQGLEEAMDRMSEQFDEGLSKEMDENMSEMRKQMETMEKEMREMEKKMTECTNEIKKEAVADGYLKSKDSKFNFSWEDEGIYINHVKLKSEHQEKYKKIWKKYFPKQGRGIHINDN